LGPADSLLSSAVASALAARREEAVPLRLAHIFAKVLEIPFAADADVSFEEEAAALRFVAAAVDGAPARSPSRSTRG
jgi:hypothetical protein